MFAAASRSRMAVAATRMARRGLAVVANSTSRVLPPPPANNRRLAVLAASGAVLLTGGAWSSTKTTSLDVITSGTPIKEPATGILFPQLCNGYYLAGVGVRIKYMFVQVYAVGTYLDPLSLSAVKKGTREAIEEALLDPTYPRTIRIVMNRGLAIDKYTAAIVESVKPRMLGQDLDKLEEFKKLNPPVDLVQGAEIEMTIRGDTLLYKNAVGGVGTIHSHVFTKALCDTYYGMDPVSPTHKESVIEGIRKL